MGYNFKNHGECCICGKSLKRSGKKCSGCGSIYYNVKHMNPDVNEDKLIRLTKEKRNKIIKKQRDRFVNGAKNGM